MKRVALLVLVVLGGCGSNRSHSGLPASERLVSLSAADTGTLCDYQVQVEGTTRTDCGSGLMGTPKTRAECVAGLAGLRPTCTATVSDAEGCFAAIGANPCNLTSIGAACAALSACSGH